MSVSIGQPSAWAATFTVTSTADAVDLSPGNGICAVSGGACTLRAAIQEANALFGEDAISLPAGTYTFTLSMTGEDSSTSGDLDISESLALTGAGAGTTVIDAAGFDRVFHVTNSSDVTLSGITLTGGFDNAAQGAGGIYNNGGLTITDCVIENNYYNSTTGGGGIRNSGSALMIAGSTIRDNGSNADGGGLFNDASSSVITITNSTFSGNAAGNGGGIANNGFSSTLEISNSTISGNTSTRSGGFPVGGGGIFNGGGSSNVAISNSTISGNQANSYGGGVLHSIGTLHFNNVTIANNTSNADASGGETSGGLMNWGATMTLENTIVADNAMVGGDEHDCSGVLTTYGYNLIETNSDGCFISSTGSMNDSLAAGDITDADPQLMALTSLGGNTAVLPLQSGSPAVDAADPDGCRDAEGALLTADQRGETRPTDGDGNGVLRCDIGAFEFSACGDLVVQAGEECDDGLGNSDTISDACRTDCTEPDCGDGILDSGEACDDGNASAGDGCSGTCQTEEPEEKGEREEEERTAIEIANPNRDFHALVVDEPIDLNAPDPRDDTSVTKRLVKAGSLPASCTCLWLIYPGTLGSYSDAQACTTVLTPQEAGGGTLGVIVDCGSKGADSETYLQSLTIGEASSPEGESETEDFNVTGGGCGLLPR